MTADALCHQLDDILNRIVNPDPVLRLERESVKHWIVTDTATDAVMLRHPDPMACGDWIRVFINQTPGARVDVQSLVTALQASGAGPQEETTGLPDEAPDGTHAFSLAASPSVKDEPASDPENYLQPAEAFAHGAERLLELLAEGHSVRAGVLSPDVCASPIACGWTCPKHPAEHSVRVAERPLATVHPIREDIA